MTNMEAEFKNGAIQIDPCHLFEEMDLAQKLELVELLSCDEQIINHVADQIIDRFTENGYGGGAFCSAGVNPVSGLDKAWRRVAKASGDIARREIERLEDALKSAKDAYSQLCDERRREQ